MTTSQRQKDYFTDLLRQRNSAGRYLAIAAQKGILDFSQQHYRDRKEELAWCNSELERLGAFDHYELID